MPIQHVDYRKPKEKQSLKPQKFEPAKRGNRKLNYAQAVLQPRNGSKRILGVIGLVVAIYSWNQLHAQKELLSENSDSQNRLIIKNLDREDSAETLNGATLLKASFTDDQDKEIVNLSQESIEAAITPEPTEKERVFHTIKRGDSLGSIMEKYSFPAHYPYQIVNAKNGKHFKNIRAGKQLEFILDKDTNALEEIHYPFSKLTRLVASVKDKTIVNIEDIPHEIINANATGEIKHSLFGAASEAGISDNMIMELAEIFGWDIDFVRDIRGGDSFKVIYEQHMNNGKLLQEGDIVAAEFINKGQTFTAIRHIDSDGNVGYYAPDGSSMKGTFLKSPMKFSRISSGFSKRRFHPVLKKWRAHKGVDYAARRGTPIRSVANGKIIHRGTKGGYGKTIIISHGGKYTTLYAHMNKYNSKLKNGKHVKQGQVIGYVGATGLATGPHLHYEFRVNGVHRNPLTYKTPKASAITKEEKDNFNLIAEKQILALNNIRSKTTNATLVAAAANIIKDSNTPSNAIESALK